MADCTQWSIEASNYSSCDYAQNSTDYALNYAPKLPIMLKLCPLILEGANLYILLCTTSQFHHQSQTRPTCLLGDLPADYMDHTLLGHQCENFITGLAPSIHGTSSPRLGP